MVKGELTHYEIVGKKRSRDEGGEPVDTESLHTNEGVRRFYSLKKKKWGETREVKNQEHKLKKTRWFRAQRKKDKKNRISLA